MSLDYKKLTYPLKVSRRIVETADTVSLVFAPTAEQQKHFHFAPAQFVTLFLEIDGQILPRSYSIPSSPLVDSELKVTIKRVEGGRGSNFLIDKVREGDTLLVTPPAGHFFRPPGFSGPGHFVLFAAGSGITPVFSILKTVLNTPEKHHVTLFYGNRNQDSIIYKKEIDSWIEKAAGRLEVVHVLSQPAPGWSGHKVRVTQSLLAPLLKERLKDSKAREFYMCGPTGFMDEVRLALKSLNIPTGQIHEESFATASTAAPSAGSEAPSAADSSEDPPGRVYIGDSNAKGPAQKLVAQLNGQEYNLDVQPGQTVLEALMNAGANPPYSCLEGACMACMAKVREGRVFQNDPGILTDESISQGETLTCQAHPASPLVKVDYDSL